MGKPIAPGAVEKADEPPAEYEVVQQDSLESKNSAA